MDETSQLLEARGKTHGDYKIQANVAQQLKKILRSAPNWEVLSDSQRDSLEMDAVKTSRILCGDPDEPDHWDDKAGYAKLVANELRTPTANGYVTHEVTKSTPATSIAAGRVASA